MPTFLTDIVSPAARKWLYAVYALVSTAIAATAVGFATANVDQPTWLLVFGAVWLFLGGAFGLTARANVNTPTE
jgi:hypothetical protein